MYAVTITQTTGKVIETSHFAELDQAKAFFDRVVESTSYQRVLVLLLEKPSLAEEYIVDVHYIEGLTFSAPVTTYTTTTGNKAYTSETTLTTGSIGSEAPITQDSDQNTFSAVNGL